MFWTPTWRPVRLATIAGFAVVWSAVAQERPTAVVLTGDGGTYVRAKDEFDLALHPGEVLFSGDRINTGDSVTTTLLVCPPGEAIDLPKGVIAEIGKNKIKVPGRARISTRSLSSCEFPDFNPVLRAAEYHLGASLFDQSGSLVGNQVVSRPENEADVADLLQR